MLPTITDLRTDDPHGVQWARDYTRQQLEAGKSPADVSTSWARAAALALSAGSRFYGHYLYMAAVCERLYGAQLAAGK